MGEQTKKEGLLAVLLPEAIKVIIKLLKENIKEVEEDMHYIGTRQMCVIITMMRSNNEKEIMAQVAMEGTVMELWVRVQHKFKE